LLAGGLGSRLWSIALAAVGLFYGFFGVIRLGVYLDIPLILGGTTLLMVAIRLRRPVSISKNPAAGVAADTDPARVPGSPAWRAGS